MGRIDEMWEALKAECCKAPPDEAKMIVFLTEKKFRDAMTPILSQLTASGAEGRDPADMFNEELDAAIDFHRSEAARFANERAKIWRMRIRWPDGGTDVDRKMMAELLARRATAPAESSERCCECGHAIDSLSRKYASFAGVVCSYRAVADGPICGHNCIPAAGRDKARARAIAKHFYNRFINTDEMGRLEQSVSEVLATVGAEACCTFPPPPAPEPEQERDTESQAIAAQMIKIVDRLKKATTHDEIVVLVWACRALIDADAEAAPFFAPEAVDRQITYASALSLYFEHAQRILGRSPSPAEVEQIETGFCEPRLEALRAERMEKGRQLLASLDTAPAPAGAQPYDFERKHDAHCAATDPYRSLPCDCADRATGAQPEVAAQDELIKAAREVAKHWQMRDYNYAVRLARYLATTHFPEVQDWRPLPDMDGVLSQIDNMICAWKPSTLTPSATAMEGRCEHGVLQSMECLNCTEEYVAVNPSENAARKIATEILDAIWMGSIPLTCENSDAACEGLAAIVSKYCFPPTEAAEVAGEAANGYITFSALIGVLKRLRSKNRNPKREWYQGWNAAIDCLIHAAEARTAVSNTSAPADAGEVDLLKFESLTQQKEEK